MRYIGGLEGKEKAGGGKKAKGCHEQSPQWLLITCKICQSNFLDFKY